MHVQSVIQEPFPGLRPFKTCEDYLFFGRDEHVYAMVDRLEATRFLTVIGVSGSGKSSLVNCGLRPALHRGYMSSAGSEWHIATCRPGSDPIGNLVQAVKDDVGLELDDTRLRNTDINEEGRREGGLIKALGEAYESSSIKGGNVLLVVDQFEEIFRYMAEGVVEKEEAHRFIQLLLEIRRQRTYPVYFTMSMRSDFLGECAHFDGLPQAVNEGLFLIPRLTQVERRAVIRGPIKVVDPEIEIEEALLTQLATELGEKPDQLTILQHALNRTWHYWTQAGATGTVGSAHYNEAGKMGGAIDQHASHVYESLGSDRGKTICRIIFQALTERGDDSRGIRRPMRFGALCDLADAMIQAASETATPVTPDEVRAVIEPFWKQGVNFIYVSTDSLDDCHEDEAATLELHADTFVDISHENLMELWTDLNGWIEEETESASIYKRLVKGAGLYNEGKGDVLRDAELQTALGWWQTNRPSKEWAQRYKGDFESAKAFLDLSAKQRGEEEAEKAKQRLKEAQQKRTRRFAVVLGVMLLFALGMAYVAWNAKNKAEVALVDAVEREALADSARLVAQNAENEALLREREANQLYSEAEITRLQAEAALEVSEALRVTADSALIQLAIEKRRADSLGWYTEAVWPGIKDQYEFDLERDFVRIEPGTFKMGSENGEEDEKPVRTVEITECFYMGKYEVTQGQWFALMGTTPSHFTGKDLPVERVSWEDVNAFIRKLNSRCWDCYQLPTEAQWEYAARAGSTTRYSFGEDQDSLDTYAWYGVNSSSRPHRVGTKRANAWGLYDMHGNVWEWVSDWYGQYENGTATDGQSEIGTVLDPYGPIEGTYRVIRGGSWSYYARFLRSAYRLYDDPGDANYRPWFSSIEDLPLALLPFYTL